jgi:uncharacterized protein Veg
MKLSKLIEVFPALTTLAQCKIPAKAGFRIAKAIALIKPELEAYEGQRMKLAESLGTKTEDGQQFKFEDDNAKSFIEQMNALTDEDVSIVLPTITPDDLGDVSIEPAHLVALYGVVIADV